MDTIRTNKDNAINEAEEQWEVDNIHRDTLLPESSEESTQDELSGLEQSPLFQLSLASKELFHSNFLSWLLLQYPALGAEVLARWIGEEGSSCSINRVEREQKNRDLVVYFTAAAGQSKVLTIENKVKSTPDLAQLEKYANGSGDQDYFLLLSLTRPSFMMGDSIQLQNGKVWAFLNYKRLGELLEPLCEPIRQSSPYHAFLLRDYVSFIKKLHRVGQSAELNPAVDNYDWYAPSNRWLSRLRTLRLYDLYVKHVHAQLAWEFHKRMESEIPSLPLTLETAWENAPVGHAFTNSGMTKGTGLSEIKYVVGTLSGKPVVLGVQIQGEQFRLFVESRIKAKEMAEMLLQEKEWFRFDQIDLFEGQVYPIRRGQTFNSFTTTFQYQYVKLKECSIQELIRISVNCIAKLHDNKQRIVELLCLDTN
ncbi:PD-(D/E)XK nuclease family protein [Paenibacillus agricola]|uniref:PD-(D/E)XK nuclease family protein n=1 Tax=Paenibacillus agricola TaxID=2716264 RepID=A0ABX0JF49_9BACL|nr:PD-(D/E)XK nuclease family protein [Paenibacillus agricola]NHN34386.1 PD-(D/E)XK nuclease family protein [Paenibacillus agricola]